MSNTAPVEKEHASEANQQTNSAISSTCTKRSIGIFDRIQAICCGVICLKISVSAAAGVTQFAKTPLPANSLPSDFVSPIKPALEAL
jgi:hypothetical protein